MAARAFLHTPTTSTHPILAPLKASLPRCIFRSHLYVDGSHQATFHKASARLEGKYHAKPRRMLAPASGFWAGRVGGQHVVLLLFFFFFNSSLNPELAAHTRYPVSSSKCASFLNSPLNLEKIPETLYVPPAPAHCESLSPLQGRERV